MSAILALDTVWLSLAAAPMQARAFPMLSQLDVTTAVPSATRGYANGVTRMVRGKGRRLTMTMSLRGCEPEEVTWLEDHAGQVLLVRDDRGRRFYGYYPQAAVSEAQGGTGDDGLSDVTCDLTAITYLESV